MDHKLILTTAALALLASCNSSTDNGCEPFAGCVIGGGGGAGGGGGTGGIITVNRDTALAALQEAWFVAQTTPAILTFVEATGVGTTDSGSFDVDPAGPTVYNCPVSGTFTVTGSITDPDTKTAGDNVNFESSACDSGTGYTVDGDHSISVTSVAGDLASGVYELGQNLSFAGFRATSAVNVVTLDGDYGAVVDTQVANFQGTAFSGGSLTVVEDQVTVVVTGYAGFADLELVAPFAYVVDVGGRASSSAAGTFDYWTAEPLYSEGGELPIDGMLDVTGANGSTARLAIEPGGAVIVQVDENGNDNFEVSVITTWDEFLAGTVSL